MRVLNISQKVIGQTSNKFSYVNTYIYSENNKIYLDGNQNMNFCEFKGL